jgi:hypothetical protein
VSVDGLDNILPWPSPASLAFSSGAYALDDVVPQALRVTATTPDGLSASQDATLSPGGAVEVDLQLSGGGTVVGRAVDAVTQAPLEARVGLDGQWWTTGGEADGSFSLSQVAPGAHTVSLTAKGHTPATLNVTVTVNNTTDLGDVPLSSSGVPPGSIGATFVGNRDVVTVNAVVSDGPAALAGLLLGDVIRSISGQPVSTAQQATRLSNGTPNSTVVLDVLRDGASVSLSVTRAGNRERHLHGRSSVVEP